MILYWLENASFCPLDKALLEPEGTVTLEVLRCRNCAARYVRVKEQTFTGIVSSISDGFSRPKDICRPKPAASAKAAMILNMKVPVYNS